MWEYFDTQLCVDLISVKSSVSTVLIQYRKCKTVVVVCSDHIVVGRLCVRRRLRVLVRSSSFSVARVGAETHLCVFLPSFRYINCIAYIASIVIIEYHFFFPMLYVRFT